MGNTVLSRLQLGAAQSSRMMCTHSHRAQPKMTRRRSVENLLLHIDSIAESLLSVKSHYAHKKRTKSEGT